MFNTHLFRSAHRERAVPCHFFQPLGHFRFGILQRESKVSRDKR